MKPNNSPGSPDMFAAVRDYIFEIVNTEAVKYGKYAEMNSSQAFNVYICMIKVDGSVIVKVVDESVNMFGSTNGTVVATLCGTTRTKLDISDNDQCQKLITHRVKEACIVLPA